VVSKNGALLLNIGPRPDGTIPETEQEILLEIGSWLETNGEAIYGTRPWKVFGEGPTEVPEGYFMDTKRQAFTSQDIRFTQKNGTLYAVVMAKPEGQVTIRSLAKGAAATVETVSGVNLLGFPGDLAWKQDENGLTVDVPPDQNGKYACVLKINHS
jgi:alpha-L-fucosidase